MTPEGYCNITEFSRMLGEPHSKVCYWIEAGHITLPTDHIIRSGRKLYNAADLFASVAAYKQRIDDDRAAREKKAVEKAKTEIKARKHQPTQRPEKKGSTFNSYQLTKIELPEIMTEAEMAGYRKLGRRLIADAFLDLGSPCASEKKHKHAESRELTISNAKRFLTGESDPEMLELFCTLSGFKKAWIKEGLQKTKAFPSRSEMKKWIGEWKRQDRERQSQEEPMQTTGLIREVGFKVDEFYEPKARPFFEIPRQKQRQPATGT